MKITTTRSSEIQEQVQVYGNATHVFLNQREVLVGEDEQVQYEYSVVTIDENFVGDSVELATNMFRNSMVLTPRQARLSLLSIGRLNDIDTAINSLAEPDKSIAQVEWEFSEEIRRTHSFVETLGQSLGLTDTDLDNMFISGKEL